MSNNRQELSLDKNVAKVGGVTSSEGFPGYFSIETRRPLLCHITVAEKD